MTRSAMRNEPRSARALRLALLMLILAHAWAAAVPAAAGVLEGTMARGNTQYENGNYAGAVAEYEKVLRYGLENSAVHYNLGNAWFKLHRPGPAILHYERALRLNPGDADAARNLAFVRSRIIDRVEGGRENIYLRLLLRIRDALTPDQAAFLFLAAWLVFSAAIFVRIIGNGAHRGTARGRLVFYTAFFALLVMAAAGLQYGLHWRHLTSSDFAIVVAEKADVTSAPGTDSKLVTLVHEGLKVRVVEAREGWLRVTIPGVGLGGWVSAELVERI
jgi:tetratricopeptide (TPR) repeat protein